MSWYITDCVSTHPSSIQQYDKPQQERVLAVVAQGDASKTLLLSLVHLKRVEIAVDARGQKAYKLWR